MKNLFFLITFILSVNSIYGQSYIGKNIDVVKRQIKKDLVKNGFTIVKEGNTHYFIQNKKTGEWDVPGKDFYQILLGQEIEIQVEWNKFFNVTNVNAFSNKETSIKKVKKIFHPEKWKFIKATEYGETYYLYDGNIIAVHSTTLYKYGIQNYIDNSMKKDYSP